MNKKKKKIGELLNHFEVQNTPNLLELKAWLVFKWFCENFL